MKRLSRFFAMAATAVIGIATPVLPAEHSGPSSDGRRDATATRKMLRTFCWQSRITFEVSGAQRRSDVFKVAYDVNGSLQRTQIGGESAKGKVRGPDGKKLSKKQLEAGREFVLQANNQLDAYLNPLFAERPLRRPPRTVEGNDLLLESHNVVHPGDTVRSFCPTATRLPRTLHATATIDGSPMQLDVTFGVLDFGPYHPAKSVTTTSWNGMPLSITTENSNYSE